MKASTDRRLEGFQTTAFQRKARRRTIDGSWQANQIQRRFPWWKRWAMAQGTWRPTST